MSITLTVSPIEHKALWEALQQFIDNSEEVEEGVAEKPEVVAARQLIETFDAHYAGMAK